MKRPRLIPASLPLLALLVLLHGCVGRAAREPLTSVDSRSGTFTGKVVGVHDGDTLTVMRGGKGVRIRLFGVDTPETKQDFGSRAKQFTSRMAFGKTARVEVEDQDRYGRLVGKVSVGGKSLNAALVENGYGWAYREYSREYVPLEERARQAKRGLWATRNPTPPWEWRRDQRGTLARRDSRSAAPPDRKALARAQFIGNRRTKVYHTPSCPSLPSLESRVPLASVQDAMRQGYHPHDACIGRLERRPSRRTTSRGSVKPRPPLKAPRAPAAASRTVPGARKVKPGSARAGARPVQAPGAAETASGAPKPSAAKSARPPAPKAPVARVDFVRDIQPLFRASCYGCHGPDQQMGGLRLDRREDLLKAGGGKVLIPGKGAQSLLVRRVLGQDGRPRMPLGFPPLPAAKIALLRAWVDQGAPFAAGSAAKHWAYVKPIRPAVPRVKARAWVRNPIDAFVLARLEKEGLRPSPEAPRETLLRRVSLDLIGLPPSPQELDAFLADPSPQAYERAVDRLLASPHFGERWARPWLDLARYADTNGYEKDGRRTIWKYRDWVIDALNRDLPFDRFTIEQIAGDLLPQATPEQKIATGFHRNTMLNEEGGVDPGEQRWLTLVDRVGTTGSTWLGTTVACAQCHDHKYDPISQKEFYQFLAFFEHTEEPTLELPTPEQEAKRKALRTEIAELEGRLKDAPDGTGPEEQQRKARLKELQDQLGSLSIVSTLVMQEKADPERPSTPLRVKGSYLQPGERVEAGVPAALGPWRAEWPLNRLGLAYWLVDRDNPLTARVTINRFWEWIFGQGLVETSEDFGSQGQPPTHPELLDWLATEFPRQGWSVKKLLRTLVTSATYRQSSRVTPAALQRDPRNKLLARGPRFRLEAEMVRDVSLAASGLLSPKIGGPSVFPPQPEGIWVIPYNADQWVTSEGADRYRRGLYTFWRRTSPYPAFTNFDATSREFCTLRRVRTNTPLQALTTLNDPAFYEMAQALARRMVREGGPDLRARLTYGFRLCTARRPTDRELARLTRLYQNEARRSRPADPASGTVADVAGDEAETAETAALALVANVLLNLDETLTKE